MKGHRLEVTSVRGGLMASCSCGEVHKATDSRLQPTMWSTYERPEISQAHALHKVAVKRAQT